MKVYEMLPTKIGEAIETDDGLLITLYEGNKKRVLIVTKKDMTVSSIEIDSVKNDNLSIEKNNGFDKGPTVARIGHNLIKKNVLDAFRHARTNDDMLDIIKKFYPLNKQSSIETLKDSYKRAVAQGVVSVPIENVITTKRKYTRRKTKKAKELTYLPVKEKPLLGKSIGGSIALNVYKRYGVRLWNNPMADVMSRVNSAKEEAVSPQWMSDTLKAIFENFKITFSKTKYNAYIMYLKESGLIITKRKQRARGEYLINRSPAIPQTIST